MLKFAFSERKAMEALAFVARARPGFTPLFVAKVFFFAEKWHLNRYGRPIIADTYIAMPRGPVPSTIKDFIDAKWGWVEKPEDIEEAITVDRAKRPFRLMPGSREPDLSVLSETDIECLKAAVEFCAIKTADELSAITHHEKAWQRAPVNGPMDYADFVDDENDIRDEILEMAHEHAACGVL